MTIRITKRFEPVFPDLEFGFFPSRKSYHTSNRCARIPDLPFWRRNPAKLWSATPHACFQFVACIHCARHGGIFPDLVFMIPFT